MVFSLPTRAAETGFLPAWSIFSVRNIPMIKRFSRESIASCENIASESDSVMKRDISAAEEGSATNFRPVRRSENGQSRLKDTVRKFTIMSGSAYCI